MIMFLSYLFIYFVYFNSTTTADVVIEIDGPVNSSEESKNESSNHPSNSSEDLKYAPPDHVIPVSKYEIPREPKTRYVPIALEFVPTQIYAQVRGTHVAKRVPRRLSYEAEGSDESRENAGRLKESVTDRKIHTVYTEEGYDNAAYDHAGHIRDGEYEESYEANPSDNEKSNEKSLDSSEITKSDRRHDLKNEIPRPKRIKIIKKYYKPKKGDNISKKNLRNFVTNGNKVLAKDLKKEFDKAAKGAETEVPDNLKNLGVDEDSRETSEQTNNDYSDSKNRRVFVNDDGLAVTAASYTSYSTTIPSCDPLTEKINELIDRNDSQDDPTSTPDYGKIFWEFFKTEKPKIHVTRPVNSTNKTGVSMTTIKPDIFGSKIGSDKYPTLTKIKNYWKNSGINAKFYPKSKEEDDKKLSIKNSVEAGSNDGNITEDISKESDKKKPDYVTIIRPPKNNDIPEKSGESSENERSKESTSPPKKISYADFFSSGERSNSSVSEESRSSEEISNESYEKFPLKPYRPAIKYRPNWWQLAGIRIQRYIHQLSHLLPPSPVRRSKYADYNNNNRRRRGGVLPRDEPLSAVDKYLKPPPPSPRQTEKLLKQTSKNTGERIKSTGTYQRNKRSTDDNIFNEAPKIVQDVIDKEIAERFPGEINDNNKDGENKNNSNENYSDEKNENYNDKENKKNTDKKSVEDKKVEIEVPEFDFEGVLEKIKNHDKLIVTMKPELPTIDVKKYPNYFDDKISKSSAMKFIVDPSRRVEKIQDNMAFYNSRDNYMNCDELDPDLSEIIPESSEESSTDGVPSESPPKLNGLGDRISCLQAKYFDKDPLDNPLFMERRIDPIEIPEEFLIDSERMKQRIADISADPEPRIDTKLSRKPEITEPQASGSNYQNQINHPDGKFNRANKGKTLNHRKRLRGELTTTQAPYHDEVYEDVMGTIKDMRGKMRRTKKKPNKKSPRLGAGPALSTKKIANRESDLSGAGWRKKLPRYRTKRVSYKTRGRKEPLADEPKRKKHTNHFRTVKVHRRSVSTDDEKNFSKEENREMIGTTGQPVVKSTEASERIYTIKNRGKNSGPRVLEKYGKFGVESTTGSFVTRRNEPRYDFPGDSGEGKEVMKVVEKGARRYDVLENVNENTKGSKDSGDGKIKESAESFDASYGEEKYKDVDRSREDVEEDEDGPVEQVERPSEYYRRDSSEKSDESRESNDNSREIYGDKNSSKEEINVDEPWDDEEKNVAEKSESEKEFERFVGRPSSFSESYYDPKYADLGPRIDKPYFHHPAFDAPEYDKIVGKHRNSGESESEEEDEEDDKEERKSKLNLKYEYPWEQQERLTKNQGKNKKTNQESYEDFDVNSSESVQQLSRKNFHTTPSSPGKIKIQKNSDAIIDNDKMASDNWPTKKFSSKTGPKTSIKTSPTIDTKNQAENIRQSVLNFMRLKNHDKIKNEKIITTTFKPQIPPTSMTLIQKNQDTTPMSELTTTLKIPRYTLRTISSRFDSQNKRKNHDNGILKSASSIIEIKSPKKLIKRRERPAKYSETVADNPENISTTTSIPRRKFRLAKNATERSTINPRGRRKLKVTTEKTDEKSSKPVRTVEHRSRVSKEEIITETVQENNLHSPGNHSSSMNKVSITTKETPNHIYRTEEINENGVRGKFITILPTNKSSINSSRDLSAKIDADDTDKDDDEEANHESQEKEPGSITTNVSFINDFLNNFQSKKYMK